MSFEEEFALVYRALQKPAAENDFLSLLGGGSDLPPSHDSHARRQLVHDKHIQEMLDRLDTSHFESDGHAEPVYTTSADPFMARATAFCADARQEYAKKRSVAEAETVKHSARSLEASFGSRALAFESSHSTPAAAAAGEFDAEVEVLKTLIGANDVLAPPPRVEDRPYSDEPARPSASLLVRRPGDTNMHQYIAHLSTPKLCLFCESRFIIKDRVTCPVLFRARVPRYCINVPKERVCLPDGPDYQLTSEHCSDASLAQVLSTLTRRTPVVAASAARTSSTFALATLWTHPASNKSDLNDEMSFVAYPLILIGCGLSGRPVDDPAANRLIAPGFGEWYFAVRTYGEFKEATRVPVPAHMCCISDRVNVQRIFEATLAQWIDLTENWGQQKLLTPEQIADGSAARLVRTNPESYFVPFVVLQRFNITCSSM